jgi:hypothetical protein
MVLWLACNPRRRTLFGGGVDLTCRRLQYHYKYGYRASPDAMEARSAASCVTGSAMVVTGLGGSGEVGSTEAYR